MLGISASHPVPFSLAVWTMFFLFTYVESVSPPSEVATLRYLRRYLPLQWLFVWTLLASILLKFEVPPTANVLETVLGVSILALFVWLHLRDKPSWSDRARRFLMLVAAASLVGLLIAK